jgi:CRISPR-associated endoribonuclease Cas6
MGSIFHGWLMEQIDTNYVEKLHTQGLNPYSQHIYRLPQTNQWAWRIATLNTEAYDKLIQSLVEKNLDLITLSQKNMTLATKKTDIVKKLSYGQLAQMYYTNKTIQRRQTIKLLTPCAFKRNGHYHVFPDVRLILQSLLKRWNKFSTDIKLEDENLLETLTEYVFIQDYRLSTTRYNISKGYIPCFWGEITLHITGPEAMVRLISLLLAFAEFSGVGIKTSLGMGGVHYE